MTQVRNMAESDLEAVRQVDCQVWGRYYRLTQGLAFSPLRTEANIRANWESNPDGCFVAEDRDTIVGYIFSHLWGAVGWPGVFGVLPAVQGQGIGAILLTAAVEHLRAAGCTTIGLETRPTEMRNVGMYMRHGFRPTLHNYLLIKHAAAEPLVPPMPAMLADNLSVARRAGPLKAVSSLSSRTWSGLDLMPAAEALTSHGEGHLLLAGEDEWVGFAALRTASKIEGLAAEAATVEAFCLLRQVSGLFPEFAAAVERVAARLGLANVGFWLHSGNFETIQTLLHQGYTVSGVRVRMILSGGASAQDGIEGATWAM